jgi:hypothetical protein
MVFNGIWSGLPYFTRIRAGRAGRRSHAAIDQIRDTEPATFRRIDARDAGSRDND